MKDDLLIAIGADLSSYTAALQVAEKQFQRAQQAINDNALIQMRVDTQQIAKNLKGAEDLMARSIKEIEDNLIIDLDIDVDDKEAIAQVKRIAKQTLAIVAETERQTTALIESEQRKRYDTVALEKKQRGEAKVAAQVALKERLNVYRAGLATLKSLDSQRAVEYNVLWREAHADDKIFNIKKAREASDRKIAIAKETADKINAVNKKQGLAVQADIKTRKAESEAAQQALKIRVEAYKKQKAERIAIEKAALATVASLEAQKTVEYNVAWRKAYLEKSRREIAEAKKTAAKINAINKKRGLGIQQDTQQRAAESAAAKKALAQRLADYRKLKADETELERKAQAERVRIATIEFKKRMRLNLAIAKTARRIEKEQAQKSANERLQIERRLARQKVLANKKAGKDAAKHWDFAGHRGLVDSTLVVAKYGAISQALYGFQNSLRATVAEMARFDQSIQDNIAILQKSSTEAKKLAENVTDVGVRFGNDLTEIQQGMITLGRAGVDGTEQLAAGTKGLAALSVITGDAMQYGAEAISSMLVVYPELNKEMGNLTDKMGAVANATRLGLEDFSTISNYALVTAANIGLTSDAYLTLLGSMSKVGVSSSSIGTSIARLGKITADNSESVENFFIKVGVSQKALAEGLASTQEGVSDATLVAFIDTLGKAVKETGTWRDAVGGVDIQMRKTFNQLALIGEQDVYGKMAKEVAEAKDITKQADIAAQGLVRTLGKMKAILAKQVQIVTPEALVALDKFVPSLETFEDVVSGVVKAVGVLASVVDEVLVAFIGWKVIGSLVANATRLNKAWEIQTVVLERYTNVTRTAIVATRILNGIKLLFSPANIALAALVATYELWNNAQQEASELQDRVTKSMALNIKEIKAMTAANREVAVGDILERELALRGELADAQHEYNKANADYVEAKKKENEEDTKQAKLEKARAKLKVETLQREQEALDKAKRLLIQIGIHWGNADEKTKDAQKSTADLSRSVAEIAAETAKAEKKAYDLATAFRTASLAFNNAMRGLAVATGAMTTAYSLQEGYVGATKNITDDLISLTKQQEALATASKGTDADALTAKEDLLKVDAEIQKKQAEAATLTTKYIADEYALKTKSLEDTARLEAAAIRKKFANNNVGTEEYTLNQKKKTVALEKHQLSLLYAKQKLAVSDDQKNEARILIEEKKAEIAERVASANNQAAKAASKGAKDSQKQQKLLDKASKDEIKRLKEVSKQALINYQIGLEGAEGIFRLESNSILVFKEKARLAEQLLEDTKDLEGGHQTEVERAKAVTDERQAQLDLIRAISAEMEKWENAFSSLFDGDLVGITNSAFGDNIKSIQTAVGDLVGESGSLLSSIAGGFTGAAIGLGIQAISELLSTTVSQEEIDAATGRTDYSDESLTNLVDAFESAQYPMLEVTNKMYKSIRNMDENFYAIARAFSSQASQGGIDLTGANFNDSLDSGFLGFSSKSVELIGTGLIFAAQNLGDMMELAVEDVLTYTTTLVKKSSFWGLSTSEKIKEAYGYLPEPIIDDLAENFANAYELLLSSGVELGFDANSLAQQLEAAQIDLGKIDFTGLSPEEVNQRLSDAFSTAFSGVVEQIPVFTELIDRYAKGTEEALETLGRLAVEYNQASHSFALLGKEFLNIDNTYVETSLEQIPIIGEMFIDTYEEAAQALTDTGFAVDYTNIMAVWGMTITDVIGYTTETVETVVGDIYTAQEQILDIVASAGGLNEFQDAMNSFIENFYNEDEQAAYLKKSITTAFDTLNAIDDGIDLVMPQTKEGFRELIETFDTTTEEGAYLYGQILLLSEGFAAMAEVIATTLTSAELYTDYISSSTDFEARKIALNDDETASAEYAVTAAEMMLDAIEAQTELYGLTMDNYSDQLEAAHLAGKLTAEQLSDWELVGDAILNMAEAKKALDDIDIDVASIEDAIKAIADAWLSNLSYLTLAQKAEYASGYLAIAQNSDGTIDTVEAARAAAETALQSTSTKEEYIPVFERYIQELENEIPEKTLDDVVDKLDALIDVSKSTEETIRRLA